MTKFQFFDLSIHTNQRGEDEYEKMEGGKERKQILALIQIKSHDYRSADTIKKISDSSEQLYTYKFDNLHEKDRIFE